MRSFSDIFTALQSRDTKKRMIAAWSVDEHTVSAASRAIDLGLVDVTLVGDEAMIAQVCSKENIDISKFTVVHNPVELKAVAQAVQMVRDYLDNPHSAGSKIRIMPDMHLGKGIVIGFTGLMGTHVNPAHIGLDIGCGIDTQLFDRKLDEKDYAVFEHRIRKEIPVGQDINGKSQFEMKALLKFMRQEVNRAFQSARGMINMVEFLTEDDLVAWMRSVNIQPAVFYKSIGTLGGGNHFIELQKDDEGFLWIMLHSGSRNLGKQVGDYYNKIAKELNAMYHTAVDPSWQMHFLPLGSKEFTAYWKEMSYCVDFALCNRQLMMDRIQEIIADAIPNVEFEPMINIAHNYAAWEHHYGEDVIVHRKGAVRARAGEIGIIPGSQGTSSYIVEGLGCPESFMSSSHGAGRLMSRTEAIKTLSLQKEIEMLDSKGIIHGIRSQNHLDEAASAYKNIDEVMANQQDLVKILTRLSPIAVVKG